MKTTKTLLLLVGLSALGLMSYAAWADEEEVSIDQVPAAVKATILKEAAGAKITEIERETKDGKTIYEAEFLQDGKEIELKIAPDGTLLGRKIEEEEDDEDDIKIGDVPEAARAALLKLAGSAKIEKVERERENGEITYEAEWTMNGVKHEAAVAADGTLLETEEIISAKDAPAGVRAMIAKHFAGAEKVVIEKKTIIIYEIEGVRNGHKMELLVSPTGRVHGSADMHDDDKGHKDKDGDDDDDHDEDDD